MPRVTLITDTRRAFDPNADPRNVAMIKKRHLWWRQLADLHGWALEVCDEGELQPIDCAGNVCWVDLPMRTREGYRTVFSKAVSLGASVARQSPDDVERVLGLDRIYPVLLAAGISTPRTAFVEVDATLAQAIDSPAAVRRLLTERIYGALFDAQVDPHDGVFVRGFYSSAKSKNPELYFGDNQTDIEATVYEVVRRLRVSLELGGLALRRHLDLEKIVLPLEPGDHHPARVSLEIRVSFVEGKVVCASFHGPYETLVEAARRSLEGELAARHAAIEAHLRALIPQLLAADLPESYVADVAFAADGGAVVLELNPLYAAGYNVASAHALVVATLGASLAVDAGYAELTQAQLLVSAEALAGESLDRNPAVWLF